MGIFTWIMTLLNLAVTTTKTLQTTGLVHSLHVQQVQSAIEHMENAITAFQSTATGAPDPVSVELAAANAPGAPTLPPSSIPPGAPPKRTN